jgi:hypothetical protein
MEELDLGNGEVFKGADWEEVARKLGEGKVHATAFIHELTKERKQLTKRIATLEGLLVNALTVTVTEQLSKRKKDEES